MLTLNKLVVVLILHPAEPVCAPARWLLCSPHFLAGPSPPPAPPMLPVLLCAAAAAALNSLLRVFLKCADVSVVVLSDEVRGFLHKT